ncbi:MFS transporter [Paraburkholderia dipogonis]|uniref:hypothetical protein n=1 Tax=Paraburkholderia dipogonis TaxID=1211383 RepID=UPI0038BA0E45
MGWTLYRLSNTPLMLGIVGIVQFVPMFLLTLPAGELCDRLSPRPLIIAGLALQSLSIGLGMLRSAPAAGACLCALVQVRHVFERRIGLKLFAAVGVFGLATVVFALSGSFVVSLAALVIVGASDMVSVNIRSSLIQLATPDAMRGRVSAVNMLFIGASSELGAFESGLAAAWAGTVPAVLLGGIGSLLVAALWAAAFPALRKADRIHSLTQHDIQPAKVMGTPPCG